MDPLPTLPDSVSSNELTAHGQVVLASLYGLFQTGAWTVPVGVSAWGCWRAWHREPFRQWLAHLLKADVLAWVKNHARTAPVTAWDGDDGIREHTLWQALLGAPRRGSAGVSPTTAAMLLATVFLASRRQAPTTGRNASQPKSGTPAHALQAMLKAEGADAPNLWPDDAGMFLPGALRNAGEFRDVLAVDWPTRPTSLFDMIVRHRLAEVLRGVLAHRARQGRKHTPAPWPSGWADLVSAWSPLTVLTQYQSALWESARTDGQALREALAPLIAQALRDTPLFFEPLLLAAWSTIESDHDRREDGTPCEALPYLTRMQDLLIDLGLENESYAFLALVGQWFRRSLAPAQREMRVRFFREHIRQRLGDGLSAQREAISTQAGRYRPLLRIAEIVQEWQQLPFLERTPAIQAFMRDAPSGLRELVLHAEMITERAAEAETTWYRPPEGPPGSRLRALLGMRAATSSTP